MGTVKIAAVMTAGRYENTWARNQIELALKTLGIPLTVSGGVYYGQCMQRMFEQLVDTDCELIVTIDGDSIFTAKQLQRLVDIISQERQIDALVGMQVRRGKADMLGSIEGQTSVEWNGYPVKVTSAHFGLSVIRVESLRKVEKPWFAAKPNESGMWEGSKIDDDVWFWKQFNAAGCGVYIDPGVRIGHLEEVITVFDEKMIPIHVYPADWSEKNGCGISTKLETVHAGACV